MDEKNEGQAGAVDRNLPTEVLAALGLHELKGVVDFGIRWNGVCCELTVTRLITRQQGAALTTLLKRAKYLISDPVDLGERHSSPAAEIPDSDFRPTPTFHRPAV